MFPLSLSQVLVASIIAALVSIGGFVATTSDDHQARYIITPQKLASSVSETVTVTLSVESGTPVNVFSGVLKFDASKLSVSEISYNESAADLWAEKPWYADGDGTIHFIGGTTKPGGFTGSSPLITVTFLLKEAGVSYLSLSDGRMLRHDGIGSDEILDTSLDTIVSASSPEESVALNETGDSTVISSVAGTSFDLSADGKQSLADVSILIGDLITNDMRSDLNDDGKVSLADLSILLQTI